MTANEDYSESGTVVIKKGDVLKDSNNDTMPVDFSGMIISVNGTYSF